MISAKPQVELAMIDSFVAHTHVEPWSAEDGLAAARARADLKKVGLPMGAMDILIGSQALNRGWSLVTENIREFVRIEGLNLIDWSDPAGARDIDRTSWLLAFLKTSKDPK
jgi:tRNA(fMet)-specific endonuclease VapC